MHVRRAAALALTAFFLVGCGEPIDPTVRPTPVVVVEDEPGIGHPAEPGDLVKIRYRLLLPDGRELLHDDEFRFELGAQTVIAGIDDSVTGMRRRGRRLVTIPPHKHWGRAGYGNGAVPPDTTLTLDVELLSVD